MDLPIPDTLAAVARHGALPAITNPTTGPVTVGNIRYASTQDALLIIHAHERRYPPLDAVPGDCERRYRRLVEQLGELVGQSACAAPIPQPEART